MDEYQQIQDERRKMNEEFDQKIKQLQDTCTHESLTQWLSGAFAQEKLCKRCMKTVESRSKHPFCYHP